MTVVCVCITESCEEVIAGIPKVVSLSTNIPSTIFYTLDGTVPTLSSTIYTIPIIMPFNQLSVILNTFASNGTLTSPIITEIYSTKETVGNVRLPHSTTNVPANSIIPDAYPFGTPPLQSRQEYLNPALAGTTVDNPACPQIPNGFDGQGNPNNFTNKPFNSKNYQIVYSTSNFEGETGPNIGNLPGSVKYPYDSDIQPDEGPEFTEQFTTTFDPRAMVIFQDNRNADPTDPVQINGQYMSLVNIERNRDGTELFNNGSQESPLISGSLIRSFYNAQNQTITTYHRDSVSNRWLISISNYTPSYNPDALTPVLGLSGSNRVFEWIFSKRQVLF